MHDLQTIKRINDEAARKVNGIVTNSNHSAKLKANRDRRVEKALKRTTR